MSGPQMDGDRSERRRVSIVLHSFDRGGSGRVAGYLAKGFAAAGLDVELLVLARGGAAERAVLTMLDGAVPVRFLGHVGRSRGLDMVRGLPPLARALAARRPDAVISAANNVALVTALALRRAGLSGTDLFIKTTNPVAGSRHRGLVCLFRDIGYRMTFGRASGIWTLSADETDELRAAFPRFASLVRDVANPYVTEDMLAPRDADPSRAKQVLAVARLVPQKRLERLVLAVAEVRSDVGLLILGEGEDRPKLQALVAELGLSRRVAMPGHVRDVASSLHASDLLVLTSDYEGFPAVVLEAMAANCPVLSTACFPAARSLLAHAPGCAIIEDHSPAALSRLIERTLSAPRPLNLADVVQRYTIANGIHSHLDALRARQNTFQ